MGCWNCFDILVGWRDREVGGVQVCSGSQQESVKRKGLDVSRREYEGLGGVISQGLFALCGVVVSRVRGEFFCVKAICVYLGLSKRMFK